MIDLFKIVKMKLPDGREIRVMQGLLIALMRQIKEHRKTIINAAVQGEIMAGLIIRKKRDQDVSV